MNKIAKEEDWHFQLLLLHGDLLVFVMRFLCHVQRRKLICQTAIKSDNRKVHKIFCGYLNHNKGQETADKDLMRSARIFLGKFLKIT